MRRSSLSVVLACCVLTIGGCAGTGPSASEKADDEVAAQLEASAAQHRADQEAIEASAAEAEADQETAPEPTPVPEPEAQQGERAAGSGSGAGGLLSAADRTSFAELEQGLSGADGLAIVAAGRGGQVYRVGTLRTGVAWSTSKVPVAMAAVERGVGSQSDLSQAIVVSDNASAERLWAALGSSAASLATEQIRTAGDGETTVQSERLRGPEYTAFGQTQWSLTDQARFVAGMVCTDSGGQVLELMRQTVPAQRWGLGTLGASAAIKGGWGPGISAGQADGWLDRQMGLITIGEKRFGVAIATTAADHGTGTANLTKIANWLKTHVATGGATSQPEC